MPPQPGADVMSGNAGVVGAGPTFDRDLPKFGGVPDLRAGGGSQRPPPPFDSGHLVSEVYRERDHRDIASAIFPDKPSARTASRQYAPIAAAGRLHPASDRWSADGWLLLRGGANVGLAGASAPPTYGASQTGAVLRYQLTQSSAHRPSAFLRATAALNGSREREAALGLSARPVPGLPIVATAEMRVNSQPRATHLRPAATVFTELPPFYLPVGARGELYAQAGYVGGNFATAFADAQIRIDRPIAGTGPTRLRAGAGSWGGAQRNAARLDIGPAASIAVAVSASGSARLALDWRFRIAGNAAPSSGPVLTISGSF